MSHDCYTDVVKFVAHAAFGVDVKCRNDVPEQLILVSPVEAFEYDIIDSPDNAVVRSWKHAGYSTVAGAKKNDVSGEQWEKDGHTVWIINESQYSNVGHYTPSVCSTAKESIEVFLADFKDLCYKYATDFNGGLSPIEDNDAVQYWA